MTKTAQQIIADDNCVAGGKQIFQFPSGCDFEALPPVGGDCVASDHNGLVAAFKSGIIGVADTGPTPDMPYSGDQ